MLKVSPRPADGGWGVAGSISCLQVRCVCVCVCVCERERERERERVCFLSAGWAVVVLDLLFFHYFWKKNLQVGQVLFFASQTSAQDAWKSWLQGIRNTCVGFSLGFWLWCMNSAQDGSRGYRFRVESLGLVIPAGPPGIHPGRHKFHQWL